MERLPQNQQPSEEIYIPVLSKENAHETDTRHTDEGFTKKLGKLATSSDNAGFKQAIRQNAATENLERIGLNTKSLELQSEEQKDNPKTPSQIQLEKDLKYLGKRDKKHYQRKLDDEGYAIAKPKKEEAQPLRPRTRRQQLSELRITTMTNKIKNSHDRLVHSARNKEHLLLDAETGKPLSGKEIRNNLKSTDSTIFERMSIMSAGRTARKAQKFIDRKEKKLKAIAAGEDLRSKYLNARSKK